MVRREQHLREQRLQLEQQVTATYTAAPTSENPTPPLQNGPPVPPFAPAFGQQPEAAPAPRGVNAFFAEGAMGVRMMPAEAMRHRKG